MISLEDTVVKMLSQDYKERFIAEYEQLYIRSMKLVNMIQNWERLDFTPTCPKYLLENQYKAMHQYLSILYERADREGIKLPEVAEFFQEVTYDKF